MEPWRKMTGNHLVSVVMIFLDAAQFIEEAIESVFAQTYDNWELWLVDDGSSDESTAIARRYAGRFPGRVYYLDHAGHQNLGMSASRNLGICHAQGQYIALLDADDVWLPPKLERQVGILSSDPEVGMVYGATQWWYSWSGSLQDGQADFVHHLGVPPNTLARPPKLLPLFLRDEGSSPCTCSVLLRHEVVDRVGGFEEAFRGLYEDQAFFFKVCLTAPVYVSGECWSKYRQHPESCVSATQGADPSFKKRFFLTWLEGYLSKHGVDDDEIWRALRDMQALCSYPTSKGLTGFIRQILRQLKPVLSAGAILKQRISAYELPKLLLRLPIARHLRCVQFRRLHPLGNGRQRGTPIVRYHWARFLEVHQSDIRGHALEIGTTATLWKYGGQAVVQADAIDLTTHSPEITITADLSRADSIPSDTYDCFVNQFTMHIVPDVEAALYHSIRILKPGGVLLANFPCIDYYFACGLEMGTGRPMFLHWWFTPIQVENLLRRAGLERIDYHLTIYGNLFTRVAYQLNMPAEELTRHEMEYVDAGHPLLICIRAIKPFNWQATKPEYRNTWLPDTTPAVWDPAIGHYRT